MPHAPRFDHLEAQQLDALGVSIYVLAAWFGVSPTAIRRVCDADERERMNERTREYHRARREPCAGGCGRLVYQQDGRTGFCSKCRRQQRIGEAVRPDQLLCFGCGFWRPDDTFGVNSMKPHRRYRNTRCRECLAADRRERRRR